MSIMILLRDVFVNNIANDNMDNLTQIRIFNEDAFTELEKEIGNCITESQTDAFCWCCGLYIIGPVMNMIVNYSVESKSEFDSSYKIYHNFPDGCHVLSTRKMATQGNFCNEFCLMRFLETCPDISMECKRKYKKNLLYEMQKKLNKEIYFIPLSYPKHYMKMYCGDGGWSEEEYRRHNSALERFYEI